MRHLKLSNKGFTPLNPPREEFRQRRNYLTGFTIVEMLVVIFIIVFLSAMVATNYSKGRQQLALERAASKLAQDMRRAQEMAMAAEVVEDCLQKDDYKYGAGIYIDKDEPNHYRLFGDCNANNKWQPADQDITLDLPDFNLVQISPNNTFKKLHIVFNPPDPTVYIKNTPNGTDQDLVSATIILSLKNDSQKTKTIKVNKAGLIYVE